jgi:hypothetical protein
MKFVSFAPLSLLTALTLLAAPLPAKQSGRQRPDPAEYRIQTVPPARPITRSAGTWIARGPAPTQGAQVSVPPSFEVCGAIHAVAAHPIDVNIVYVGAVNGGIWKSTNANAQQPIWTALTESLPSQSIGALVFDPTDASHETLLAGTGRVSSFFERGDDQVGVYRTVDGGANWTQLGVPGLLLGEKIIAVIARGPILLAASQDNGLFRSTDAGANWAQISGTGNLPAGGSFDLVGDAGNPARLYIAVRGASPKILRSDNTGASWTNITTGITGLMVSTTQQSNMRLSVGAGSSLYLAVVDADALSGVFRSSNQGSTWTAMDVPAIHPGLQGYPHTSIAADPLDPNLVYLGGDRITIGPFTGNLVRGNAAGAPGTQFTTIMGANGNGTAPHADSRSIAFDANGNLLEGDDGGIYRRSSPSSSLGAWSSVIGNLNVMEVHDLDHDRVANVVVIGTQDNGTHMQQASGNLRWAAIKGGDGGDVAIDDSSLGNAASLRYLSTQNLGNFTRDNYNASNVFQNFLAMPTVANPQFLSPFELNKSDPTRLALSSTNTMYEITGANTGSPTLISLGPPGANTIAFGARNNANATYIGNGASVFVRAGGIFVATAALPAGANTVTDIAMDPGNDQTVFAIDDDQVFRSINGGVNWSDVSGNLISMSALDFRSIEYIADAEGDSVAVGTRSGVYTARSNASVWSPFGSGLPDVLVYDLKYVASTRTLYAGTLGRGVWSTSIGIDAAEGQFDIIGPVGSEEFGRSVTALPNGNIVITARGVDDRGVVYLYSAKGNLISTLTGSNPGDRVGAMVETQIGNLSGIIVLGSGHFVVLSPQWDNGAADSAGAVTWGNAATGVNGVVSAANSLVGNSTGSFVGSHGVTKLVNGNYVVRSPAWRNGTVVGVGAVTWGNGLSGVSGAVTVSNSLIGSTQFDEIGSFDSGFLNYGVTALSNGNYVVSSKAWNNGAVIDAGAVTWGNGLSGTSGVVSPVNSLVGSSDDDRVGHFGVTALSNGHYVVASSEWSNGATRRVGASTWGNGTGGTVGAVSPANSLIGSVTDDHVGYRTTALNNGHYVVISYAWNHSSVLNTGAVTWVNGSASFSGVVNSENSTIGARTNDQVGRSGVTALNNGNYVIQSPFWDDGAVQNVGAATWRNGSVNTSGVVSAVNSIVGSSVDDYVSRTDPGVSSGVTALANGNYVVVSSAWDRIPIANAGAVTWCNGSTGLTGIVSSANSLIGSAAGDYIGDLGVIALSNGNYVTVSSSWNNGIEQYVGAVTWGNGVLGTTGFVSESNSLTGTAAYDQIGSSGVTALANGSFVIASSFWRHGSVLQVGAATWSGGSAANSGAISSLNSLIGTTPSDAVGNKGVTPLSDDLYVVRSSGWNNGGIAAAGAITVLSAGANSGAVITAANSIPGLVAGAGNTLVYAYDPARTQLIVGQPASNIVSLRNVGLLRDGFE